VQVVAKCVTPAQAACTPAVVATLNFGFVPTGVTVVKSLFVKNAGPGACQFVQAHVLSCGPQDPLFSPAVCSTAPSAAFQVVGPTLQLLELAAGETAALNVRYSAGANTNVFAPAGPDLAVAVVEFAGPAGKVTAPANVTLAPASMAKLAPNIKASHGAVVTSVAPPLVEFGSTPIGCKSAPHTVSAEVKAPASLVWKGMALDACNTEFGLMPPFAQFGVPLQPGVPVAVHVVHAPKDVGPNARTLRFVTEPYGQCANSASSTGELCENDGQCPNSSLGCMPFIAPVPLVGLGHSATAAVDEFVLPPQGKADIVVLVHGDLAKDVLKSGVLEFEKQLKLAGLDFHVGVASTEAQKLGQLHGLPRVLTANSLDLEGKLALRVGSVEQGSAVLAAAVSATSPELTADSNLPCTTDADCPPKLLCVQGADDGKFGCGGPNRMLLRPGVPLHVVIAADQDDAPAGEVAALVAALKQQKPDATVGTHGAFHPLDGACKLPGTVRLHQATRATHGIQVPLCQQEKVATELALGTTAMRLPLAHTADPMKPLVVSVNAQPCLGFVLEPTNDVVRLVDGCKASAGSKIQVAYALPCAK
jgi:hypothetical protein